MITGALCVCTPSFISDSGWLWERQTTYRDEKTEWWRPLQQRKENEQIWLMLLNIVAEIYAVA